MAVIKSEEFQCKQLEGAFKKIHKLIHSQSLILPNKSFGISYLCWCNNQSCLCSLLYNDDHSWSICNKMCLWVKWLMNLCVDCTKIYWKFRIYKTTFVRTKYFYQFEIFKSIYIWIGFGYIYCLRISFCHYMFKKQEFIFQNSNEFQPKSMRKFALNVIGNR